MVRRFYQTEYVGGGLIEVPIIQQLFGRTLSARKLFLITTFLETRIPARHHLFL